MSRRRSFRASTRSSRVLSWTMFVVVTVLAPVFVAVAVTDLANPNAGVPGTAVVRRCGGPGLRKCYGTFVSADGRTQLRNTQVFGADHAHPGQSFAARDNDGTVGVPGSGESRFEDVSIIVVAVALWVSLLWIRVIEPLRWRRAARARRVTDVDDGG